MDTDSATPLHLATAACDAVTAVNVARSVLDGSLASIMWWSPRRARWQHLDAVEANPTDMFEFRAFDGQSEVRWVRASDSGHLCVLSDAPVHDVSGVGLDAAVRAFHQTNDTTYLLWGEATEAGVLLDTRIGTLSVPGVAGAGRHVLEAREYLAVDPTTGTAYVAEERLRGVRPDHEPAATSTTEAS